MPEFYSHRRGGFGRSVVGTSGKQILQRHLSTYLPDLLLRSKICALVPKLLRPGSRSLKVLSRTGAFNVNASPLVVKLLISLRKIVEVAHMHCKLILIHAMTISEGINTLR